MLISEARVFREIERYLEIIEEVAREFDPGAEVYLFGSVAEGRRTFSSDIDVLKSRRPIPPSCSGNSGGLA